MAPLILTLGFDAPTFAVFERLRQRHFPARRNLIPAHLTLFHALPGERLAAILDDIARAARAVPPMALQVGEVIDLGRGAAFRIDCPALLDLRGLAERWRDGLSAQDRSGFRPHVTVQNKVDRATAQATLAELRTGFVPFAGMATGLKLWHYRGGPWEPAGEAHFTGDDG